MTPEERAHLLGTICGSAQKIAANLIQSFVNDINRKDAEIQARDDEIRRLRTMIADHECSGVPFGEAYKREPPPDKLTNIEWLYRHPEKLAETLFCPFEDCKYDEAPLDDGEDICYKCLLDWLKEEHNE
jgi:hypothetical protein